MLPGLGVQESLGNPCPGFQRPAPKPGAGPRVPWESSWGQDCSTLGCCRQGHLLQPGGGGTWLREARKPLPRDRGHLGSDPDTSSQLLWVCERMPSSLWLPATSGWTPEVTVSMGTPTASVPLHCQAMDTPTQGGRPSPAPECSPAAGGRCTEQVTTELCGDREGRGRQVSLPAEKGQPGERPCEFVASLELVSPPTMVTAPISPDLSFPLLDGHVD